MPRPFGQNIVIDGGSLQGAAATAYESDVDRGLTLLLAFQTGLAVIHEIWSKPRHLRILPYRSRRDPINATATAMNARAATAPFQPVRSGTDGHAHAAWGHGTGTGSDVRIRYSPGLYKDEDAFEWDINARAGFFGRQFDLYGLMPPGPGDDPAEVLLHELVHAVRAMSGRENCLPMDQGFDTREEFFAVLVTNIYSSERGVFRPLRADHGSATLADPQDWRDNAQIQTLILNFSYSNPSLTHRLARVKTAFNPFTGSYPHNPDLNELPH